MSAFTAVGFLRRRVAVLLLSVICCFPTLVCAGHPGIFKLEDAHSWRVEGSDYLNAQFSIELSSGAEEAVQNGVPLVFELQVQVVETHTWLWDSVEIEFTERRMLQYHALSQSYQVKDLNDGTQGNYSRLDDALRAAGVIENLLLTDQALNQGPSYSLRIRGSLDVESLPTPVRLIAYVSSEWDMVSKWYKWPLVR
ncbi:MAG: DUF4390 domain-containing protein [Pseudomonadota bacterium]